MINILNYHRLGKHWLFLTLIASLALFVAPQIGCNLQSHPADQAMEERFQSNRDDFNRLAQMFAEDNDVVRLTQKSVFLTEDSNRSLTEERLRDYRGLFVRLGLNGGMHRGTGGKLQLIASNNIRC